MRSSRMNMKARGFSLVELLTVIAIIALVISIIIPVLGGARNTAKRVATQQLLSEIASAAGRFKLDNNGRNPGYFSERQMGDPQNATRGLSGMENAMLDLAGGNAIMGTAQTTPADVSKGDIVVGPTNNPRDQIVVRAPLLGTDKGAYFTPSGEHFEAQLGGATGAQVGVPAHAGLTDTDPQLRDVVDSFGDPILFWSADTFSVPRVNAAAEFAQVDSTLQPALFYWNSNAAFLKSSALGRKQIDHTVAPAAGREASLIGLGALGNPSDLLLTMQALLGSTSAPRAAGQTIEQALAAGNIEAIFPGAGRGSFVIQSAGSDGVFLSSKDKGFSSVAHEPDHIDYGLSFFSDDNVRYTDDDGNPSSRDVTEGFDDVIVGGGG